MTEVTCAIIEKDGKVLATQRARCIHNAGKWEFPGGKIEPGETADECIVREIIEELNIRIVPITRLEPVLHHYPDKTILLIPYICKIKAGSIKLKDHAAFRWLHRDELKNPDWAEADMAVVEQYLKTKQT